ncbi:MAG: NifB/NifX family molybdenum-iron cluster-binding protein [Candidatus Thermoplasmatota archaeon]|nr:NifB/NifX family molybdenum-iron cluster-binding protein [Candidatus Thermoplasmatota archaeon]
MKIAVTSRGREMSSETDPRFGRCRFFIIVDPDTKEFQTVENESSMAMGGAGPQASQTISRLGVEVLITGNVGPNAFQALKASGIKVMIGATGTVEETIDRYGRGELEEIDDPSVASHSGMRQ